MEKIKDTIQQNKKIYMILYHSFEYDDIVGGIQVGDFEPRYISTNKDDIINKFNDFVKSEKNKMNNFIQNHSQFVELHQDEYNISADNDNEFVLNMGNWCYHYKIAEFELNKDLKY